jgi:RNase P subunit RPR2
MKVITPKADFKPFRIGCKNCDAFLEIDDPLNDLTREQNSDFRESWDYLIATCPECKGVVRIETDAVPKWILEKL